MQFEENLELKQYKLSNYTVKKSNLENCFIISMKSLNNNVIRSDRNVILKETITKKVIYAKIINVRENDITIKVNSR